MSFITTLRAAARLAPMLALPLLAVACDDTSSGGGVCGAQLSANIETLVDASADFQTEADALAITMRDSCEAIINGINPGTAPTRTGSNSDQANTACTAAANLVTTFQANITVQVTAPRCYIDAQAQIDCEAECSVDGECDPGTIEARCTPGEFSVQCSGTCEASAECVATATAPSVTCNGACEGICESGCSGSTDAQGQCSGTCAGQCRGACTVAPGSASASCTGEFRCEGSCTGTATAPRCEADLNPPSCTIDANCSAGCEGQASIEATCEPAQVIVTANGPKAAQLEAVLEAQIPKILAVSEHAKRLYASAQGVVTAAQAVVVSVSGVPACAAVKAQEIAGAVSATAAASVSINVSVMASASVATSAEAN